MNQGTKVDAQSSLIYKDQQHLHFIRETLPSLCMPSTPTRGNCQEEGKEGRKKGRAGAANAVIYEAGS